MTSTHLKTLGHMLDAGSLIAGLSVAAQVWTPIVGFVTAVLSLGWIVLRWVQYIRKRL